MRPAPVGGGREPGLGVAFRVRARSGSRSRPAWAPVARLVVLTLSFAVVVAARGTSLFRILVGEDGVYEWLQAGCLAGVAVLTLGGARRVGRGRRRLVLAGVGLAALVVVGEELAWGTRLFDLEVESVQAVNHQGDFTLHNLGIGLEVSFLAMATVSSVLAVWQVVRRSLELACWFAVPAVYGVARLLTGPVSYGVAKVSEVAELAFAVAALRLSRAHSHTRQSA